MADGSNWANRNLFTNRFCSDVSKRDAYVTGYMFMRFIAIPDGVYDFIAAKYGKGDETSLMPTSSSDLIRMLSATCNGVPTLPNGTVAYNDLPGLGGTKWTVEGNVDYDSNIQLNFTELGGAPVSKSLDGWSKYIWDPNTGMSNLPRGKHAKKNYSASLAYWTTKPNGLDVEFAAIMEGSFPTQYLSDNFGSTHETVGGKEFSCNFHIDSIWWDKRAYQRVQQYVGELETWKNEYVHGYPKAANV